MTRKLRNLQRWEYDLLNAQYIITPDPGDGSFGPSGEHYVLYGVLRKLGFSPLSRADAYELAEQLLTLEVESD